MSVRQPISKLDNWFTGEDQDFVFTVYQDDDLSVQDISGWTVQLRLAPAAGQASILSKTGALEDPEVGVVRVSFDAADTQALVPKKYWYTLSRTDSGFNQVLADGPAWLQARVT